MNETAIHTQGLTKRYGPRTVVDALSFEIPSNVVCGFIGRNGAGKTTTIRMLLGLIQPTEGTATVLGSSIASPKDYLGRVGAMIEGPAFYPTMTGRQNLDVLRRLGGIDKSAIDRALEIVEMSDRADELVKGYSLGMRQRLGIAASILPNPKLLILDEPTNGLDPQGIRDVRSMLRRFADEGITVLVSSHLLDELQHISDHLVLIEQGKLQFRGTPSELLGRAVPRIVLRPEFSDDSGRLMNFLARVGYRPVVEGESIVLSDNESPTPAELNRLITAQGLTLSHLSLEHPRLEDVFFDMTDKSEAALTGASK